MSLILVRSLKGTTWEASPWRPAPINPWRDHHGVVAGREVLLGRRPGFEPDVFLEIGFAGISVVPSLTGGSSLSGPSLRV